MIEQQQVVIDKQKITINDMLQQCIIKISLPSVFSQRDLVQLKLIGYRFDPNRRLLSNKQGIKLAPANVGTILVDIKQQIQKSYALFQERDWKNLQRQPNIFCFELEIQVKIVNLNTASYGARGIVGGERALYSLLSVNLNQTTQLILGQNIAKKSQQLLESVRTGAYKQQQNLISFAPQKIYNPHLFIKTVSKDKYLQYYTKGLYEYFHYGDQSYNDHGWGCAYRSLQTLLSWFSLQNHVKLPKIPTISQIQETIDKINLGSKDKLKDTREWIGATEVSWVIKHLTNYDCRILHISDGKKIIQQCEVIREHFEKVGCPIMYGGGQYAYTIVGINYSWKLGQCQFLILDPHYPGNDSLDKIFQKKGLCWRKPEEMFKKGIFYNFCLPIIPE